MLNAIDKSKLEEKIKNMSYAQMLGAMVLEATPVNLRNRLLQDMNVTEAEFILSAGAIIAEVLPYEEFVTRVEALKARIENDEEPADLSNPDGEKITDADATDVLYVNGLILASIEAGVNQMYSEVLALPDSVNSLEKLNIKNEVPDAIKTILQKDSIGNFTADVMRAITTDIKNDIAIREQDQEAENEMITKVGELEGDKEDLSDEAIPPESGDLSVPDVPADETSPVADGNEAAITDDSMDLGGDDEFAPIEDEPITTEGNGDDDSTATDGVTTETAPTDIPAATEDDFAPISEEEQTPAEGDAPAVEGETDEVGVDDSVDITDDDAEPVEGEDDFAIGDNAGAEDGGDMTPIETEEPTSESTPEDHLNDLNEIHDDTFAAIDDTEGADDDMIQESYRRRCGYIPVLQNLAVKLFKEDLENTRRMRNPEINQNSFLTHMDGMFAEAAQEAAKNATKTNPLTQEEYNKLLYAKVQSVGAIQNSYKEIFDRYMRRFNNDEKKAKEAFARQEANNVKASYAALFDVTVWILVGLGLGFLAGASSPLLGTYYGCVALMTGIKILSVSSFIMAIIQSLGAFGVHMQNTAKVNDTFDTAMNAVKYARDLTDAERAKVETYAKEQFDKYNKMDLASQMGHTPSKWDPTNILSGFFDRMKSAFA